MYQGKHSAPKTEKKSAVSYRKRKTAMILSLVLILTVVVGGTLAYFMDTEFKSSSMKIGEVECAVSIANDNTITVTNNGDVPVRVRVAVVANWVSETNSNEIHYTQPTVSLAKTSGWELGNDGFYYYNAQVTQQVSMWINVGGACPDGYKLQIRAMAEAIQDNAQGVWKYAPSGN